jgi:hypothetical protein
MKQGIYWAMAGIAGTLNTNRSHIPSKDSSGHHYPHGSQWQEYQPLRHTSRIIN